jgi:hypothetical protein
MISVSKDFAPPLGMIVPYFIAGALFYLCSALFALFVTTGGMHFFNATVIGWVHLYLLGFVMMIIFGAMAQLVPVVLEVGHFAVAFYYLIWPLLLIGTVLMVAGFLLMPALLPYGGTVVLLAMMIFILDNFLTLRKVGNFTFPMQSVVVANLFLFLGVIAGIVLALVYAGRIDFDPTALLKGHVFAMVGGYIMITVMGLSMVLIPMFGLAHDFSWRPVKTAVVLMSAAAAVMLLSALFGGGALPEYLAYFAGTASLLFYGRQVVVLYRKRARKEHDIYAVSLYAAYGALAVSLLLAAGWMMFVGFFGFLITGHLYKIVPFLVWFERFSPLVGKEKVPMLAEMLPDRGVYAQSAFSAVGTVLAAAGILLENDALFKGGASFLSVGAVFLLLNIFYIVRFK